MRGQGGTALIGIFVFVILHFDPASGREIELSAKSSLPARPVPVSIENVANANDLLGVRPAAGSYNGSGTDGGERQLDAMHPAWEVNRGRNFFVLKLNFARKHSLGEAENMTSNARHLGIGITGIDVSETYRNGISVRHTPDQSQAIDGNSWPMRRDEFFVAKLGGFFGGRDGALQLDALPAKYEKLEKSDDGKSGGRPKKQFSEAREPPIILSLFVLVAGVGGGLLFTLFGWQNFYNDRRLLGASLVGLGCLIGLSGLGWWWSWLL